MTATNPNNSQDKSDFISGIIAGAFVITTIWMIIIPLLIMAFTSIRWKERREFDKGFAVGVIGTMLVALGGCFIMAMPK